MNTSRLARRSDIVTDLAAASAETEESEMLVLYQAALIEEQLAEQEATKAYEAFEKISKARNAADARLRTARVQIKERRTQYEEAVVRTARIRREIPPDLWEVPIQDVPLDDGTTSGAQTPPVDSFTNKVQPLRANS